MSIYLENLNNTSEIRERALALEALLSNPGACDVNLSLDYIDACSGRVIVGSSYALVPDEPRMAGGQAVVAIVQHQFGNVFAAKFFSDRATFELERDIYSLLVRFHSSSVMMLSKLSYIVPGYFGPVRDMI